MLAYVPDILLLLISSLACLYCMLLSRRLKKLQSLDVGLGASIVSLTQAITDTSTAAHQAREATEESVDILRCLLRDAQDTLPLIEARIESLHASRDAAKKAQEKLDGFLNQELKPEMQNARNASRTLLKTVHAISEFKQRMIVAKKFDNASQPLTKTYQKPSKQEQVHQAHTDQSQPLQTGTNRERAA